MRALLLALAALAGCASAAPTRAPALVSMAVSPRIAFAPATVRARLTVRDPALACAAVAWDWSDGSISARESDCDPDAPWSPYVVLSEHRYQIPSPEEGFTVTATVQRARVRRRAWTSVVLR